MAFDNSKAISFLDSIPIISLEDGRELIIRGLYEFKKDN